VGLQALLDDQAFGAMVRPEDRAGMAADGTSEGDIEAVADHLAMVCTNELVPTKPHILRHLFHQAIAKSALPTLWAKTALCCHRLSHQWFCTS